KGDVRLLRNGDSNGTCGRGRTGEGPSCGGGQRCAHQHAAAAAAEVSAGNAAAQGVSANPRGLPPALCLREAYLTDRARLDQVSE
ncbi:unnamed protein product, partial [Ectocarpus sp. 8 AP-2014]